MAKRSRTRRLDYELIFAAETRLLSPAHKQALILQLRRRQLRPPPARVWWIVDPSGEKRRL